LFFGEVIREKVGFKKLLWLLGNPAKTSRKNRKSPTGVSPLHKDFIGKIGIIINFVFLFKKVRHNPYLIAYPPLDREFKQRII
jgi:hypothetical protein